MTQGAALFGQDAVGHWSLDSRVVRRLAALGPADGAEVAVGEERVLLDRMQVAAADAQASAPIASTNFARGSPANWSLLNLKW